jgi:hypothetical protein
VPNWTREEKEAFLQSTRRLERYRLAGKTLKFWVYGWIETLMIVLSLSVVAALWIKLSVPEGAILSVVIVIGILGALHHLRLIARMPWVICTAVVEGFILWAIYVWGISRWVEIPGIFAICVIFAVTRYWNRAEDIIEERAYLALKVSTL